MSILRTAFSTTVIKERCLVCHMLNREHTETNKGTNYITVENKEGIEYEIYICKKCMLSISKFIEILDLLKVDTPIKKFMFQ